MEKALILVASLLLTSTVYAQQPTSEPPKTQTCTWANRYFSHGAIFCMGPTNALKCNNGKWEPMTYVPCNNAPPVDTK